MLISIPPSPFPSYTSSLHDDMAFCLPLTRQATPFSPPPVLMLPPAQPGPSYQQPSPVSSKQFTSPAMASSKPFAFSGTGSSQKISSKPPVSPTKQTLQPVDVAICHNSKLLNPIGIGRRAIDLALESVFGTDQLWPQTGLQKRVYCHRANFKASTASISDSDF